MVHAAKFIVFSGVLALFVYSTKLLKERLIISSLRNLNNPKNVNIPRK